MPILGTIRERSLRFFKAYVGCFVLLAALVITQILLPGMRVLGETSGKMTVERSDTVPFVTIKDIVSGVQIVPPLVPPAYPNVPPPNYAAEAQCTTGWMTGTILTNKIANEEGSISTINDYVVVLQHSIDYLRGLILKGPAVDGFFVYGIPAADDAPTLFEYAANIAVQGLKDASGAWLQGVIPVGDKTLGSQAVFNSLAPDAATAAKNIAEINRINQVTRDWLVKLLQLNGGKVPYSSLKEFSQVMNRLASVAGAQLLAITQEDAQASMFKNFVNPPPNVAKLSVGAQITLLKDPKTLKPLDCNILKFGTEAAARLKGDLHESLIRINLSVGDVEYKNVCIPLQTSLSGMMLSSQERQETYIKMREAHSAALATLQHTLKMLKNAKYNCGQ